MQILNKSIQPTKESQQAGPQVILFAIILLLMGDGDLCLTELSPNWLSQLQLTWEKLGKIHPSPYTR